MRLDDYLKCMKSVIIAYAKFVITIKQLPPINQDKVCTESFLVQTFEWEVSPF